MEAYCNAVRALEDKFYSIELNHIPRRYNKEADELAKTASRRITIPPNVFARDIAKPYVNLEPTPSSQEEPSGAPSNLAGAEPMDEDPSNEAFVLSLLEGYSVDEAEAMDTELAPRTEDWRARYLAWMDGGELSSDRSEARRIARMAKSFTLVNGELYKRAASGFLQRCIPIARSSATSMRACAATMQRHAPSSATCSARDSTGPPRSPTPARSCTLTRGVNSTTARSISQRTPSR
jgi:hypothetical protein